MKFKVSICFICLIITFNGYGYVGVHFNRPEYVSSEGEKAIKAGLHFLKSSQNSNGSWTSRYPLTNTSLALMALMASGSTPNTGEYANSVSKAIDFVLNCSRGDGLINATATEHHAMYGHGFAMLSLSQAYGMEADPLRQKRIEKVLNRAINLTARGQCKDGGWYYSPESRDYGEGSVAITQVQSLRACRNAGLYVPPKTIERAQQYLKKLSNKDGSINYSLTTKRGLPAITAAAYASLHSSGLPDDPTAIKAYTYLKQLLTKYKYRLEHIFTGHVYYGLLYLGQSVFMNGDKDWKVFFPKIQSWLAKTQAKNGSWKGGGVGETYGTSIALITLQLPYRRLPIYQR